MAKRKAPNGSGSIIKRKDGRYEGKVTVGHDPVTGRAIRRSVYAKTQEECARKTRSITASVDNGTYIEPSKYTFGQWMDIWWNEYLPNVKPTTREQYAAHIRNHVKPYLGNVKLSALKPDMIQHLYNRLLKTDAHPEGLSAKSIKNLHGIIHKALKQAALLGYLPHNPAQACVLPRIEKKEVQFLEEGDIGNLLAAIRGDPYEYIYTVDVFTGLRQGEILGLTWDCVDFSKGVLTIDKQLQKEHRKGGRYMLVSCKTDRVRRILATPYVMGILKQQQKKQRSERLLAGSMWSNDWNLVFTNALGGHLCSVTVYNHFKRIVKSLGLPNVRFHDMRHTYAVLSLQNGDDIKTVQSNVGHATASFTLDVYGHVSQKMRQDSADRMQSFIDGLTAAR